MNKTIKGKKYCSPNIKTKKSCYTKKNLVKMIKKINKKSKKKIKIYNKTKNELWKNIDNKMKSKCKTEWCWNNYIIDLKTRFRPLKPENGKKNQREWLDTNNLKM